MRLDADVGKYLARIASPSIHPSSFALFRVLYCGALLFFMWDNNFDWSATKQISYLIEVSQVWHTLSFKSYLHG